MRLDSLLIWYYCIFYSLTAFGQWDASGIFTTNFNVKLINLIYDIDEFMIIKSKTFSETPCTG